MDDVVFEEDKGVRMRAQPEKGGFTIVGFLIDKKLADTEQQALLWVAVTGVLLALVFLYFISKTGALESIGISGGNEIIRQMSPDRFENNYPINVENE